MTNFNLDLIPRIPLCILPTPILPLARLSKKVGGAEIYVKRDDLTGIAFGGNKNRKLEFLLADALQKGANTIITEGALQSNHCLQTAACAAKLGLNCELVLSGDDPETVTGNLLLQHILEVGIHRLLESTERKNTMKRVEEDLLERGKKPYLIPTGGSNKIGAIGYIACMKEIAEQAKAMTKQFDYFVHASGSAGTQAGLLLGKALFYPNIEVVGISVGGVSGELAAETRRIIKDFEEEWGIDLKIKDEAIQVFEDYFGEGYSIPTTEMVETLKLVAQLEGIFLDPVYNGKAMVGLIDLLKKEHIPKEAKVLFLHSGGGPSIFHFAKEFRKPISL